jgi:hypothetical protein
MVELAPEAPAIVPPEATEAAGPEAVEDVLESAAEPAVESIVEPARQAVVAPIEPAIPAADVSTAEPAIEPSVNAPEPVIAAIDTAPEPPANEPFAPTAAPDPTPTPAPALSVPSSTFSSFMTVIETPLADEPPFRLVCVMHRAAPATQKVQVRSENESESCKEPEPVSIDTDAIPYIPSSPLVPDAQPARPTSIPTPRFWHLAPARRNAFITDVLSLEAVAGMTMRLFPTPGTPTQQYRAARNLLLEQQSAAASWDRRILEVQARQNKLQELHEARERREGKILPPEPVPQFTRLGRLVRKPVHR